MIKRNVYSLKHVFSEYTFRIMFENIIQSQRLTYNHSYNYLTLKAMHNELWNNYVHSYQEA